MPCPLPFRMKTCRSLSSSTHSPFSEFNRYGTDIFDRRASTSSSISHFSRLIFDPSYSPSWLGTWTSRDYPSGLVQPYSFHPRP